MIKTSFLKFILLSSFSLILSFQHACGQILSKQNHNVNIALNNLKKAKSMQNAGIGFYALDVNTGEVIADMNGNLALAPASTMKLITSATALEVFGKNFRFKTKIEYRGYIDTVRHILNGDIIIRGGGDPTLGSRYFTANPEGYLYKWADIIKNAGIDSVNGYIIADARIYSYDMVPPTWSWEDMGNYFGAGACGLSAFDNAYALTINTGNKIGDTVKITGIKPKIENLNFDNTVTADNIRSDLSYIFGQPYTYHRYIRGRLPVNRTKYIIKGSMPDPAYFTAKRLSEILKSQNINCIKPTTYRLHPEFAALDSLPHTSLYVEKSVPLSTIIQKLNFKSLNLVAEHLINHIGYKKNGTGNTKSGAEFIKQYWQNKGINTGGLSINDGSGLSRYNTVTTKQMSLILKQMQQHGNFETYYASIPAVGKEGTVRGICKGSSAVGNMHAKSGSIRAVRAYAGYVKSKSGREIAFSFMINNYNGSSSAARRQMEKVMIALAEFEK